MSFSQQQLLKMYEHLAYARAMYTIIREYSNAGKVSPGIHPTLGQEACLAGLMTLVDLSPVKIHSNSTHRQQAFTAYKIGLDKFLGELLSRQTGVCGGLAGEHHHYDLENGHISFQGILGSMWPFAVGYAWALKQQGKKDVVVTTYGDGGTSEGGTFEAMNIAALKKVPVVFVIENNGIALSTPVEIQAPVRDLSLRAEACGMMGVTVDGQDVVAVAEALLTAVQLASQGEPNLVELKVIRMAGHHFSDAQKYRDLSFLSNRDAIDPLKKMAARLIEAGHVDEAELRKIDEEQEAIMRAGFDRALEAPFYTREQLLDYNKVYANSYGGEI